VSKKDKELREEDMLIANRVPPGDRWTLIDPKHNSTSDDVIEGLVETLSEYMRATNFSGDYKLSPLKGKLYAIHENYVEIEKPKPKKYDLYGEF
jgi:hypothetical protein